MLIPINDMVLMTSASTLRFRILIFMVTPPGHSGPSICDKPNHDHFYESLDLDAVTSNMVHLLLIPRRFTVHYWTKCQKNYAG